MSEASTDTRDDPATDDEPVVDGAAADAASDGARPNRHLGPVIALGLAVAVAVAAVVVALVGGDDVSPTAVTVNGSRTTSATLDAELDGFSGSDFFADSYAQATPPRQFSATPGSISSLATAQWLSFRTQTALAESILAREGAGLTQSQVDAASKQLAQQGITDGMSSDAADQLARFSASGDALSQELGSYDAYRTAMRRAARQADVSLDPKYGRWAQRNLAFCVPAGCAQGGATVVPPAQGAQSGG
jgi:hypothetical protein